MAARAVNSSTTLRNTIMNDSITTKGRQHHEKTANAQQ
jgi:hypothetical protein